MPDSKVAENAKILTYKGRPLVRSGPVMYLGSAADEFVAMLTVISTKKVGDLQVADRVTVQIIATDTSLSPKDRIVKKSEKDGLYHALNIATIWLDKTQNKES